MANQRKQAASFTKQISIFPPVLIYALDKARKRQKTEPGIMEKLGTNTQIRQHSKRILLLFTQANFHTPCCAILEVTTNQKSNATMRDLPTGSVSHFSVKEVDIFRDGSSNSRVENCRNDSKQITRLQTKCQNNNELFLGAGSHFITLFVVSFVIFFIFFIFLAVQLLHMLTNHFIRDTLPVPAPC